MITDATIRFLPAAIAYFGLSLWTEFVHFEIILLSILFAILCSMPRHDTVADIRAVFCHTKTDDADQ